MESATYCFCLFGMLEARYVAAFFYGAADFFLSVHMLGAQVSSTAKLL